MCCLPEWPSLPRVAGHWKSSDVNIRTVLPGTPFRLTNATLVHVVGSAGQEVRSWVMRN